MTQNRNYVQSYTKKAPSKRGLIISNNGSDREYVSGVKKPDSYKIDSGKYDMFGRVSKRHAVKLLEEKKNSKIDQNENSSEVEKKIGSEQCCSVDIGSKSESELLKEMFGISQFETSKNKSHSTTSLSGFNAKSRRKYRQYMNRSGGFNRPLSPVQ
ncbi:hypothetical protein OJ253_632 [Cryptosporidium canis]|uniref:U4/U6.U5 small nuclear ribonucleoprotein 27kDa protein domain-containing protein n=1 Tax=Cryptosporidium canis TaxID=195482 RepID=A0A9D5HZW5_9CRYT|nr:hypothetical protein OJ253_632 [Cryptosporidium canis]